MGTLFYSLKEVSSAVTQATQGLNKSGIINGIANLLKYWDVVIEQQGDYVIFHIPVV